MVCKNRAVIVAIAAPAQRSLKAVVTVGRLTVRYYNMFDSFQTQEVAKATTVSLSVITDVVMASILVLTFLLRNSAGMS